MNFANGFPETTSTMRPSVLMPLLQYSHLLPGGNLSGCCE